MKYHIDDVRPRRPAPEPLAVQHVRQPGQRMPVAGVERRKGPNHIPPPQPAQDVGILRNVKGVVVIEKIIRPHRPVQSQRGQHQRKTDHAGPHRARTSTKPDTGEIEAAKLNTL